MNLAVYEPALRNGNGHPLTERSTFDILGQAAELAQKIAPTEFVPTALRNKPAAVVAAILTGHEVGLPPMASLSNIHIIEGKPTLSAQAMRALVLSKGHTLAFEEMTISRVTIVGQRRGEENPTKVTWTLDDAKRASLDQKPNWKRYPRAQLIARATGELCRAVFADVIGGIAYTTEELQDEGGEALSGASPPEGEKPKNRRRVKQLEVVDGAVEAAPAEDQGPPEPELPSPLPGAEEETSPPPPGPSANDRVAGEPLSIAQQIAMECRNAGIDRAVLIKALTGKTSGREVTREQAVEVLGIARAISRGEMHLVEKDGDWVVLEPPPEKAAKKRQKTQG